jgi:hypothetical protein
MYVRLVENKTGNVLQCNTEALSPNYCCRGKAVSTKYSKSVFLMLLYLSGMQSARAVLSYTYIGMLYVTTARSVPNLPVVERPPDMMEGGFEASNILSRQSRTADKGWSSRLSLSEMLTTSHRKNLKHITNYTQRLQWAVVNGVMNLRFP